MPLNGWLRRAWTEALEEDRERASMRRGSVWASPRGFRQPKRGRWQIDMPAVDPLVPPTPDVHGLSRLALRSLGVVVFAIAFQALGLLPEGAVVPLMGLGVFDWAGIPDRREEDHAANQMVNMVDATITGARGLPLAAKRDAGIAELLATSQGGFRPEAKGAVGDDVAEDAAAVQATLNAAAGVAPVVLTKMYRISTRLTIPTGTTIIGLGWHTGLHFTWTLAAGEGGSTYIVNSDTTSGNTGITFRDFRVLGAHPGGPLGNPAPTRCGSILFRRGSHVRMRNMEIDHAPGIGLAHQGISNFQAVENYVHDNGRDGITGGPFGSSPSDDVTVALNHILDNHDDHIACNRSVDSATPGDTPPRRWLIIGNVCRGGPSLSADNFSRGCYISGGEDIEVIANRFEDMAQWGLFATFDINSGNTRCARLTITDNKFRRAGKAGDGSVGPGHGVELKGIDDLIAFNDNEITDSDGYGLFLAQVDGWEADNNTILRNGTRASLNGVGFGVWLAGASAGNRDVKNGQFTNNRVAFNNAAGIHVQHCDDVDVFTNRSYNNGQSAVANTLQSGIVLLGGGVVRIHGNACTDNQGSPTQRYGFAAITTAADYLSLKGNDFEGNSIDYWIMNTIPTVLHVEVEAKRQTPAFAASFTPDPRRGEIIQIGALTGNITVNDATALARIKGLRMTFVFTQDGTGGRTVAFNAAYKKSWSDTGNTLGLRSSISFEYDGTNWQQIGAQSPYV